MKLKLLFAFVMSISLSFAQQIPEDIKPPSWSLENLNAVKPHKLESFDVKALIEEDIINDTDKSKPWRFGQEVYVDHNANEVGKWTTLPNGDRIWRMSYKSEGAISLNFMFDIFWIPEGATLYVYNDEKDDLIRPFTHHNNNPEEILGTWYVKGEQAWIEYYQPASVIGEAKLTIGAVVHGYRSAETMQKALNDSGACNHDVDCDIAPATDPFDINTRKEEVKKAAALLILGGGTCSGTLVNNTNNDGTPYFLTANHCGSNEGAWAFRFNWRSPNPSCGTFTNSTNGPFNQTVSGATRRAASSESDMKLVEINDTSFFNNNPDVVWSGWNKSTTQTPQINFGVHHPSGDIQKACRDDDGATRSVISFNGNATTEMWRIADWDLGVTEGGSSGSGLFNEEGHLIGMLSGGAAACSGTNDNNQFDVYGRFGVGWDFGPSAASRLRDWLDPGNTGVVTLGVFPPLNTFDIDATASAVVMTEALICNEDFTPQVTLKNLGNLNLNSATVTYSLDSEPEIVVNWTGSLINDESEVVASPVYSNLSPGSHSFVVTVGSPNGTTDENLINNTFTFNFDIAPEITSNTLTFNILTDTYASETTWELTNSSGAVVVSGPASAYTNTTSFQETITLPVLTECYTFTIFDSANDGICCGFGIGNYNLQDSSGNTLISSTGDFGTLESTLFFARDPLNIDEYGLENLIDVYPNPVNDNLNIVLNNINEDVTFEIYNTIGQKISNGSLSSNSTHSINMSQYQNGIYFVKLTTNSSSIIRKVIKN